ncbi:acyltransferase [Flavobacteriaceae bacterium F89]|uniref:Acyltransferase n=1 Tax=Cerina litoralis TaxID=2874477 RepID=A0AAE3EZQ1_9FLAO|nr:acyltransferase [Cerina litoralis]MCG2462606.1 acyltransferase [Cerina litoralis]
MKYFERIDGLRFIAIILVLIEHFAFTIGKHFSSGYYGVDLFFVISGFLITSILIKPNEKSFRRNYINFIGRRTLRIFPIYYLTILFLWLINLPIVREKLIWLLTYTYNYAWVIYDIPITPINHFWSLGVEEQFYIFWPIVVLTLKRKPKTLIFIILLVILIGYSQMIFELIPTLTKFNYVAIFTRMASLALGAFGAVLATNYLLPRKFFQSKIIEYCFFLILLHALVTDFRFKVVILGLSSLYLVLKAAYFNFSISLFDRFLRNKMVIKIGLVSYGIYIFHLPIAHYFTIYIFDPFWIKIDFSAFGKFEKLRWHSWLIKLPLYSFLSIFVANLSYKYIETPILKLKDRYFKYE